MVEHADPEKALGLLRLKIIAGWQCDPMQLLIFPPHDHGEATERTRTDLCPECAALANV
jgi:hypothetical protein